VNINFVINPSPNYAEVQRNILAPIMALLDPAQYSQTEREYRDGSLNFSLFIRERTDVVMSHGAADKNYFWISRKGGGRYADGLKALFVPGKWLRRRILKSRKLSLRPDQVITVGWPRLDVLRQTALERAAPDGTRKRILWAPTHDKVKRGKEQRSTSTYPDFERHMPALQAEFDAEASVHPRNREDKRPTVERLVESDYVVSDFGTLVYEAWALGKPVFFPRWILGDRVQQYLPGSAEAHILANRIGYHPDSFDEMMDMLRSGPVVTPDVDDFMDDYLDNYRGGNSAGEVVRVLTQMVQGAQER
jgi:hypothetical protein